MKTAAVLEIIETQPGLSSRAVARMVGCESSLVRQIRRRKNVDPFKTYGRPALIWSDDMLAELDRLTLANASQEFIARRIGVSKPTLVHGLAILYRRAKGAA